MSEVRRHKTFDQDVATIIDYIRSSGGTIVTINTVVEKTGLNAVYANNVLRVVKESPIIEFSKDELNKKATFFKIKEEVVPVPTEIKMHKKYKSLTEDQVGYVQSILAKKSVGTAFDMLMSIINALASFGGVDNFIDKYAEKIGDVLIIRNAQVRLYADVLEKAGLLLVDSNRARLLLSGENAEEVLKLAADSVKPAPKVESPAPVKVAPPPLKAIAPEPVKEAIIVTPETEPKIEPVVFIEEPAKEPVQEPVADSVTSFPSEIESTLVENMESFKGFIGQFQNFIGEMISQVNGGNSKSEIEELKILLSDQDKENAELKKERDLYKKQLEEGNKSLTRILTENSNLKEALTKKCEENRANKKVIAAHKEANDNVFAAMQERFQILLADISNTISDYTRIPAWQLTPNHTARVQSQIINAVTAAMNDLIESNCATIVE